MVQPNPPVGPRTTEAVTGEEHNLGQRTAERIAFTDTGPYLNIEPLNPLPDRSFNPAASGEAEGQTTRVRAGSVRARRQSSPAAMTRLKPKNDSGNDPRSGTRM